MDLPVEKRGYQDSFDGNDGLMVEQLASIKIHRCCLPSLRTGLRDQKYALKEDVTCMKDFDLLKQWYLVSFGDESFTFDQLASVDITEDCPYRLGLEMGFWLRTQVKQLMKEKFIHL